MPTQDLEQQIRARTEAFADELTELVKRAALESVSRALGSSTPVRATARAKASKGRVSAAQARADARKKGEKRTPESLQALTEELYAQVKSETGRRIEEIAQAMGVSTKELVLPAKKLLEGKRIKTVGHKRATKYYPK